PAALAALALGAGAAFTWPYDSNGAGAVVFSATASGWATVSSATVTGAAVATEALVVGVCGDPTGVIATIAGTGVSGYNGDGIAAATAQLKGPAYVAYDAAGNLYIAEYSGHRIRKVSAATGLISTVAGTGVGGYNGDGISAVTAQINTPTAVALDAPGNLYIAEASQRVRKVSAATGLISTVAGNGTGGYNGDGIAATAAWVWNPYGLAVDPAGNLHISDNGNHRIRKISAATGLISTVAGTGSAGYNGDGIAAATATLTGPAGIVFDGAGALYIADQGNYRVRKVNAATGLIATVAGTGAAGYNGDGIAATTAQLNLPTGIGLNGSGVLFFTDWGNNRLRTVDAATGLIRTVAGTGAAGFNGDGLPAAATQLSSPNGIAFDAQCRLTVGDYGNQRVRRIALLPLAAWAAAVPSPATGGQLVQLRLTVSVTGGESVNSIVPVLELNSGAGLVSYVSGPAPASFASLAPGAGGTFTWTYSTQSSGAVTFTATANGTTAATATAASASASGALVILPPGSFGDCPPTLAWSRTYSGAGANYDEALRVTARRNGDVVTGGYQLVAGARTTWLVRKYSAAGPLLWSRTWNAANQNDLVTGVAEDGAGNVYVTGKANSDIMTRKYDSNGNVLWTKNWGGAFGGDDFAERIAVAGSAVYVAGREQYGAGSNRWVILKYDTAGNLLWTRNYAGGAALFDTLYGAAVDGGGNVIVNGDTELGGGNYDWMIRKYDTAGTLLWFKTYDGPTGQDDISWSVATDSLDNVIVAGRERYSAGGYRWVTRKYDSGGTLLWSRTQASPAGAADEAKGVAVTVGDQLLVCGYETRSDLGTAVDWVVRRYDAAGTLHWSVTYNGPTNGTDYPSDISVAPDGSFVVVGTYAASGTGNDWMVRKYTVSAGLAAAAAAVPAVVTVGQSSSITLTVTNSGCVDTTNLTPALAIGPGAGLVSYLSGPTPASVATLPAGFAATFTWTYRGIGPGVATFTLTATGTDAATGGTLTASASTDLVVMAVECGVPDGLIQTIAGTGTTGYNGDGIPATDAQVSTPYGLFVDLHGNVLIADDAGNRVRRIDAATGMIATLAGTGVSGWSGDDIAATASKLGRPLGVAGDEAGNTYVADWGTNRIRKI
ncbi:MAG: hypothetical protein AAB368_01985, partial [bacterium]